MVYSKRILDLHANVPVQRMTKILIKQACKENQAAVSAPSSCSVFRFVQGMFHPKGLLQPVEGV
jgi:hypothetical protein